MSTLLINLYVLALSFSIIVAALISGRVSSLATKIDRVDRPGAFRVVLGVWIVVFAGSFVALVLR